MDISIAILAIAVAAFGFFIIHPGLLAVFSGAILYWLSRVLAGRDD